MVDGRVECGREEDLGVYLTKLNPGGNMIHISLSSEEEKKFLLTL